MNFASWYALRFFPSLRKLEEALMKKTMNNTVLVAEVMKEMGEYIKEDLVIE
jgi:hypothetical protein